MSIDPKDPAVYDPASSFPAANQVNPTLASQPYGQPVVPYAQPQASARAMDTPVKVIGICYLIIAVLGFLGALFIGTIMQAVMASGQAQNPGAPPLPASFGTILAIIIGLVGGLLPLITGIGLLRRASWGRVMAIVNGILILISIPFGTILGGITLYYMLRSGAKEGYDQLSRANPGF